MNKDRQELERILVKWGPTQRVVIPKVWYEVSGEVIDDLLRWKSGEKLPWCNHLKPLYRKGYDVWVYHGMEADLPEYVGDSWIVCPICGAKRPE